MDMALTIPVGNFISQGNGILQNFRSELGQLETPSVIVAKDLLAEGAGEFVADLLVVRRQVQRRDFGRA